MIRGLSRAVVAAFIVALAFVGAAQAQSFQKSYNLASGGQVRLGNVSGDMSIVAYDGPAVLVSATKRGSDVDRVEIQDQSSGNSVDIRVKYPENCNNCNVSVDFSVQVPRGLNLRFDKLSSVSGDITVQGVTGSTNVASVSGDVSVINVNGPVSANSVSGDVDVEISSLDGNDDMKFNSVSGDVNVKVPSSISANVDIATLSGEISSDFPIEIKKERYGPGRTARAQLAGGSRFLKMNSVSGDIQFKYSTR